MHAQTDKACHLQGSELLVNDGWRHAPQQSHKGRVVTSFIPTLQQLNEFAVAVLACNTA